MIVQDLSTFADQLRREGFDARSLGQVGITIWEGKDGFFISAEELRDFPMHLSARDFHLVLERRRMGLSC